MKTSKDPRHKKRIHQMQELFSWDFKKERSGKSEVDQIISNLDKIDDKIVKAAPTWPITKINRIDLAILRLSLFELLLSKDAPPKVIIDEAVELAKEYGGDSSPAFVNGVLGKVIELEGIMA